MLEKERKRVDRCVAAAAVAVALGATGSAFGQYLINGVERPPVKVGVPLYSVARL